MDYYAVIGNPIWHTKSPLIHQLFAHQTNKKIRYEPILVDLNNLPQALNDFEAQNGKGLNITAPFKREAFNLVDTVTERAALSHTVNTIKFNSDGTRHGDNTDGIGLIRDLTINQSLTLKNKQILLLGAGGAIHAIIHALLAQNPAEIIITNRTLATAEALAKKLPPSAPIKVQPLTNLSVCDPYDLIINGTTATQLTLPPNILNKQTHCYDLSYHQTPFLEWVQTQNPANCINGLGMLIEQAAEAYYFWHKIRPDTQTVLSSLCTRYRDFRPIEEISR